MLQLGTDLLAVLVDGFEKNEVLYGFHWRQLPMPDEASAITKFRELVEEAARWKGNPDRAEADGDRRIAAWADMEIRQVGRGVMVRVEAPRFDQFWNDASTWVGDPIGPIHAWIEEEAAATRGEGASKKGAARPPGVSKR